MNSDVDIDGLIAGWLLEEAPQRAPDRILAAAAARIDGSRPSWRMTIRRVVGSTTGRRLIGIAAVVAILVVGLTVGRLLPSIEVGPAGAATASPSPTSTPAPPSPSSSASEATERPSASPASGLPFSSNVPARIDTLCALLTTDEIRAASRTPWDLQAQAGRYLDHDPNCKYIATGGAPLTPDGERFAVAIIEELVAPNMRSYWDGLYGVAVPVDRATARWVKGMDTLVVTKGDMMVVVTFQTEQSQVAGHGTPPPAGSFEAGAVRLAQTVVDRMP